VRSTRFVKSNKKDSTTLLAITITFLFKARALPQAQNFFPGQMIPWQANFPEVLLPLSHQN
jgi:hypothetical protein